MTISKSLKLGVSTMVLASGLFGASAHAQSAAEIITDEIFVTGTKKQNAENVQDVPIAMTAYNTETLEARKVRTLEDLSFSAPNVSLDDIGTSRGTANFAIRGLGVNSSIPSIDPAVGVFIDGVYQGLNSGSVFDLFDLDSVEVMRGPQGILFGRNTTGGAVLINTGNPTDTFQYKARFAIDGPVDDNRGGINTYAQGVVSGPLVDGVLNGKLGVYYNNDDGYFKNLANNSNHGEAQLYVVRGALEWMPTDEFSLLGKISYSEGKGDGPSATNRGRFSRDSFDFAIDNEGFYDNEQTQFSLKADYDVAFGDGTITNIFGYIDGSAETDADIDAAPAFLFHSQTELTTEQISNELRYAGTFGKAEVTTGLFYFNNDVAYTEVRMLPPLSPLTFYGGGAQDHTVLGLFGQIDYSFNDNFVGILGLRYSKEDKDAAITYVRPRNACSVVDGSCPTTGNNALLAAITGGLLQEPNGFTDSNEWENFSPKVGFQYFTNAGNQIYGNYTKGFRSGGYNFRITDVPLFLGQLAASGEPSFDEEEVDAFELGFKYRRDDRKLTLNGAIFTNKISDMQREVNLASPGAGVSQFIINTADADIYGAELDGQIVLLPNLIASANVGLISASYTDVRFDISGDAAVDSIDLGLELPRVPKSTYGFGIIHSLDMNTAGTLNTRVNFQHRDKIAYTDNNFGWIQSANMLSANVGWDTPVEGVSLSLYGNNLLDEVQVGGDTQLPFPGPLSTGVDRPFADRPALTTFSPLKKGRVVGIELIIKG
ncbi:TonB-dependent receptor [Robiginitomaculum antarcticum]|uniref:TonB-dependent receptor n=1 Tax=Robiginitomaculum antarcticum TaxID=437507 RepID=UPI00036C0B0D|nr:TonB-dependent receptor [Robiginitomaculum antarcticum]